jgi:hypothetical protein
MIGTIQHPQNLSKVGGSKLIKAKLTKAFLTQKQNLLKL